MRRGFKHNHKEEMRMHVPPRLVLEPRRHSMGYLGRPLSFTLLRSCIVHSSFTPHTATPANSPVRVVLQLIDPCWQPSQ
jgi:hypothetical protein